MIYFNVYVLFKRKRTCYRVIMIYCTLPYIKRRAKSSAVFVNNQMLTSCFTMYFYIL